MTETRNRFVPLVILVLLAVLAIGDGVYLTLVHLDYLSGIKTIAGACQSLSAQGCAVTAGRFGSIAGIPVATIGLAGAASVLMVGLAALRRRDAWEDPNRTVLLALTGFSVAASLTMGVLSTIEDSFCPFCLIWYGLNIAMFAAAFVVRNRGRAKLDTLDDLTSAPGFLALGSFALALLLGIFIYNSRRATMEEKEQQMVTDHAPEIAERILMKNQTLENRVTVPALLDNPTKGPSEAEIVIVEFGDFECPHCQRLWNSMNEYLATTERSVQVRFANFPLHSKCNPGINDLHPHACDAAVAGVCAEQQGKFWEMGQLMFDHQKDLEPAELREYASEAGLDLAAYDTCIASPDTMTQIRFDIGMGIKLDIKSTPTFFVNGYPVAGAFPAPILAEVIEQILAHQNGEAPAQSH